MTKWNVSAEYEAEQRELTEFVKTEQAAVDTYEQDRVDFESFAAIIRKYVGIKELTPTIVNEFVKKDNRPRPGQVQWTPQAENPNRLELHRGTGTGRQRTNH